MIKLEGKKREERKRLREDSYKLVPEQSSFFNLFEISSAANDSYLTRCFDKELGDPSFKLSLSMENKIQSPSSHEEPSNKTKR